MNNDEKKVNVDEELLDKIAGGKIKEEGKNVILMMMDLCKQSGKSKEECIATAKEAWKTDYRFRVRYSANTIEDLREIIDFIDKNW